MQVVYVGLRGNLFGYTLGMHSQSAFGMYLVYWNRFMKSVCVCVCVCVYLQLYLHMLVCTHPHEKNLKGIPCQSSRYVRSKTLLKGKTLHWGGFFLKYWSGNCLQTYINYLFFQTMMVQYWLPSLEINSKYFQKVAMAF